MQKTGMMNRISTFFFLKFHSDNKLKDVRMMHDLEFSMLSFENELISHARSFLRRRIRKSKLKHSEKRRCNEITREIAR